MAAFTDLDWRRFDVAAIVNGRGIGVVAPHRADACRSWLRNQGYSVESWDFGEGIGHAMPLIGERLRWVEQFGYALTPESRNLDALRDGFLSEEWGAAPVALELRRAERAWREDGSWFMSVLAICQEQSLCSLAVGRRFLTLLVLEASSPLVGQQVDSVAVPRAFWQPGPPDTEFTV